jgi:hypothetical protein
LRVLIAVQGIEEEPVGLFDFLERNWWQLLIVTISGIGFIYLVFRGLVRVFNWRKRQKEIIAASEEKYFKNFYKAIQTNDKKEIMRALMFWFDRFRVGKYEASFKSFLNKQGDEKLKSEVEKLEQAVFGKEKIGEKWTAEEFYQQLIKARKNSIAKHGKTKKNERILPSLKSF